LNPLLCCVPLLLLAGARGPDVANPEGLWKPLGPPRTGEWRDVYHEEPQTLAEYRRKHPQGLAGSQRRIYLQPLLTRPPADPGALSRIRTLLSASCGHEAVLLAPRPLPREAYDLRRGQVSIARLLPALLESLPGDGLFLLAVTDRDIFIGDTGFTYGWGSLEHRVGVISTYRLDRNEHRERLRRRILGLALHESGHLISLPHCSYFACLMNGVRGLSEADRRPMLLCPVCRSKLCWRLRLAPDRRYEALGTALEAAGLPSEARLAARARAVTGRQKKG
jgi:archaemetzincin